MADLIDDLRELGFKTDPTTQKSAEELAAEQEALKASNVIAEMAASVTTTEEPPKEIVKEVQGSESTQLNTVNYGEILEIDELKGKPIEEVKNYVSTLRKSEQERNSEIEQLKSELSNLQSPFESEEEAKAFYFKSATKLPYEIAKKLTSSNLKDMPALDVLVMNEILKNPSKADKVDLIREMIEEDYGILKPLTDDEKDAMTDDQIKTHERKMIFNAEKLEFKSDSVREELVKKVSSVQIPQTLKKEEIELKRKESFDLIHNKWNEVSSKILPDEMPAFPIHSLDTDNKLVKVAEIKIPPTELAELRTVVSKELTKQGILPDKVGQEAFHQMVYNTYVANNYPKLLAVALAEKEKEYLTRTSNAGTGKVITTGQENLTKKQQADKAFNELLNS